MPHVSNANITDFRQQNSEIDLRGFWVLQSFLLVASPRKFFHLYKKFIEASRLTVDRSPHPGIIIFVSEKICIYTCVIASECSLISSFDFLKEF